MKFCQFTDTYLNDVCYIRFNLLTVHQVVLMRQVVSPMQLCAARDTLSAFQIIRGGKGLAKTIKLLCRRADSLMDFIIVIGRDVPQLRKTMQYTRLFRYQAWGASARLLGSTNGRGACTPIKVLDDCEGLDLGNSPPGGGS